MSKKQLKELLLEQAIKDYRSTILPIIKSSGVDGSKKFNSLTILLKELQNVFVKAGLSLFMLEESDFDFDSDGVAEEVVDVVDQEGEWLDQPILVRVEKVGNFYTASTSIK